MFSPVDPDPDARMPLADAAPRLPVIELRPGLIDGLEHAPSKRWREALLSAGLLAEVSPSSDPDDPRGWILALQSLLAELIELEDARDGLMWIDDRPFFHDAPWWMWLLLVAQPWLALTLGQQKGDGTDPLVLAGLVYIIPGFCTVLIVLTTAVIIQRRRRARTEELGVLRERIKQVRSDLADGARRTLQRDFVALAGERLLVCTPSLSRGPGPHSDPALDALRARVEALKQSPSMLAPAYWEELRSFPDPSPAESPSEAS